MSNEKHTHATSEAMAMLRRLVDACGKVKAQIEGTGKVMDATALASLHLSASINRLNALRKDAPGAPVSAPPPEPAKDKKEEPKKDDVGGQAPETPDEATPPANKKKMGGKKKAATKKKPAKK